MTSSPRSGLHRTEAAVLHDVCREFLSGLDFELVNDPAEFVSPYLATRATYKNPRQFFLRFGFEPVDGHAAYISCGRRWVARGRELGLSCDYSALASRFELAVPVKYPFHSRDRFQEVLAEILNDLQRTLPAILARVTLDDLIRCEEGPFTARHRAEASVGPDYLRVVEISEF